MMSKDKWSAVQRQRMDMEPLFPEIIVNRIPVQHHIAE